MFIFRFDRGYPVNLLHVITDDLSYAGRLVGTEKDIEWKPFQSYEQKFSQLFEKIFSGKPVFHAYLSTHDIWQELWLVKHSPESHFDILVDAVRARAVIPDFLLCISGGGSSCRGFKGRSWRAVEGNLHLVVHSRLNETIAGFASGCMALPAVAVLETLEQFEILRNRTVIKWVNDILVDGAKISGVLAHTHATGQQLNSLVLGIGVNILGTPDIARDTFAPRVAALKDLAPSYCWSEKEIFFGILGRLSLWQNILKEHGSSRLIEAYIKKSIVIGKNVAVALDDHEKNWVEGKVLGIGKNLELLLDSFSKPVNRGRLLFLD